MVRPAASERASPPEKQGSTQGRSDRRKEAGVRLIPFRMALRGSPCPCAAPRDHCARDLHSTLFLLAFDHRAERLLLAGDASGVSVLTQHSASLSRAARVLNSARTAACPGSSTQLHPGTRPGEPPGLKPLRAASPRHHVRLSGLDREQGPAFLSRCPSERSACT